MVQTDTDRQDDDTERYQSRNESKEKEKIIHVLQLLLSNIEQEDEYSFPKLLLHVASYYNRVVTVDTYLTQYDDISTICELTALAHEVCDKKYTSNPSEKLNENIQR